jgi:hypothetical protein
MSESTPDPIGRVERMEQLLQGIGNDVAETKRSTEQIRSEFQGFRNDIMGNEATGSRGIVWRLTHLEDKVTTHDKRLTKVEKMVYGIMLVAGAVTVVIQVLNYLKV